MRWRWCGGVSLILFPCGDRANVWIDEGHVKDSANAKMLMKFRPGAVEKVLGGSESST